MKFTGYITVRLNSKRLPQKSIKSISNSPLINTAVKKLNQIKDLENIVLYCSDDSVKNYIDKNLEYEFVKRPKSLDGDLTTFNDILDSLIDKIETEYIIFLSVTSPFISVNTIKDMIQNIKDKEYDSSFLAYETKNFCWYKGEPLNYKLSNKVKRTQDLSPIIVENSGLYIFSVDLYKKHRRRIGFNPYIKVVDTIESWDIDTPEDFKMAQIIGEHKQ